jgi:hypothetical protein
MFEYWIHISPLGTFVATALWFGIGLPAMIGAYYQSWKARREAGEAREAMVHSADCLEFVSLEGSCINLVPLDKLHSLPRPGDVVMLPGHGVDAEGEFLPGAFLVKNVEHIYSRVETRGSRPQEARLSKAVAQVTSLHTAAAV